MHVEAVGQSREFMVKVGKIFQKSTTPSLLARLWFFFVEQTGFAEVRMVCTLILNALKVPLSG